MNVMTDVNASKSSLYIQSTFSIVKNMLSDPEDFDREFRCSTERYDSTFLDEFYAEPEELIDEETFAAIMRGERLPTQEPAPIVMGLSEPRVIAVTEHPDVPCSEYQSRAIGKCGRPSVGLFYPPNRTWTIAESLITYFEILDAMSPKEFAEEQACSFYTTMREKATELFVVEDKIFLKKLIHLNYTPNWMVMFAEVTDMAIELPNGNRIVFDDF